MYHQYSFLNLSIIDSLNIKIENIKDFLLNKPYINFSIYEKNYNLPFI